MRKKYIAFQSEDYKVWQDEKGDYYFGARTPLSLLLANNDLIDFVTKNPFFDSISFVSYYQNGNNSYRMHYNVKRCPFSGYLSVRVCIDTRGDFEYHFDY